MRCSERKWGGSQGGQLVLVKEIELGLGLEKWKESHEEIEKEHWKVHRQEQE